MSRTADFEYLAMRAKKMAGSLGRIPGPGELVDRFKEKQVKVSMEQAGKLVKAVQEHQEHQERQKSKPQPKSSVAPSTPVHTEPTKTTRSYGK